MNDYTQQDYQDAYKYLSGRKLYSQDGFSVPKIKADVLMYALQAMADPDWQLTPKEPTEGMIMKVISLQGETSYITRAILKAAIIAAPAYGEAK